MRDSSALSPIIRAEAPARKAEAIRGAWRHCTLVAGAGHAPSVRLARRCDSPRCGPGFLPSTLLGLTLLITALAGPVSANPDFAQQVLALINAYRSAQGLAPVQADPVLLQIAEASSREQAAAGRLSHSGFSKRFAQADRGTCVENLAAGLLQPEALVAAWQASPVHRRSLVAPVIRYAGLAKVNGYVTFFACD